MIPWIDESVRRGHKVLTVGPPDLARTVARLGYPSRIGASPPPEVVGPMWAQVATMGAVVEGDVRDFLAVIARA